MSELIVVEGKKSLSGEIVVQGAKNSVLPILAASILSGDTSNIYNCPDLKDVKSSIAILRYLGCKVERIGGCVSVDPSGINRSDIPHNLMHEMRSSVIFLGAILSRFGRAQMSSPGGCELGPRPIDLHLDALKKLGATVEMERGGFVCQTNGIIGADITLSFPSVGATENVMLAAAISNGITTVTNAAKEPEIEDLQDFLNSMGASISGAGTGLLTIRGTKKLHGTDHRVISDRIAAATYLAAAGAAGGEIKINDIKPSHLSAVLSVLAETGCSIVTEKNSISLIRKGDIKPVKVRTMPYPGFPTDAQAIVMAYSILSTGTSIFIETIFESRFKHVDELIRMGADISVSGKTAIVNGVKGLYGAKVNCTDLRGGAALIIAALAADGVSEIDEAYHVDRGYENIEKNLTSLGAKIKRMNK